jgi:hypothetical protein
MHIQGADLAVDARDEKPTFTFVPLLWVLQLLLLPWLAVPWSHLNDWRRVRRIILISRVCSPA